MKVKSIKQDALLRVLLVSLLLLTFFLRVFRFNSIQFDSDFGRDSLFAWRIVTEKPTLIGAQASVGGFFLGPFYFYAIAGIFAIFGPVPEMVMLGFALLNLLAAFIGYNLLKEKVNVVAGILFLLLFATQPLLIAASRGATHVPMLPFITVLSIAALVRAIELNRRIDHILCALVFGLFLHVHFSALLLFPGYFLVLLIGVPGSWKKKVEAVVLHGVSLLFMISPLILFDVRHGLLASKAFIGYLTSSASGGAIREGFPHWSFVEKIQRMALYIAPTIGLQLLAAAGAVVSILQQREKRKTRAYQLMFVTGMLCSIVVGLLLLYKGYLFPYYLVAPGTLILFTVSVLLARLKPWWIGILFALIVGVVQLRHIGTQYMPQYRTLAHLNRVVSVIEDHQQSLGNPPFTVYKDSSDQLTGLAYEYRFLLTRDGFVPVDEFTYADASVLYVIREDGRADPLSLGGHEMAQFGATSAAHLGTVRVRVWPVDVFVLKK